MRFTEVEGKSKQDAMEKAARELNVPVSEIGVEILSDSSRGFFSLIGGRKVKIRAWSKRESREKLREEVEKIRDEVGPLAFPPPTNDLPSRSGTRGGASGRMPNGPETRGPAARAPARTSGRAAAKSARSEPRGAPKSGARPSHRAAAKSARSEPRSAPREAPGPEKQPEVRDPSAAAKAEEAKKLLEGLLVWLSEQCEVHVREATQERIRLEILGDKTGLLIGKRGQTLDALQFLINKMVNRTAEDSRRIEVDMEQYRKRREQSLRSMATRLGEKVKKKKKPITIEAMNAHDRRIIHLALKSDPSLETRSVGKGEMRKLVIHLANNGRSKGNERSGASS